MAAQSEHDRFVEVQQESLDARCQFVFMELEVGLTFCRLLKRSRSGGLFQGEYYARGEELARRSLSVAEKFMWQLRDRHHDFDQMTAQAERLRFELETLNR